MVQLQKVRETGEETSEKGQPIRTFASDDPMQYSEIIEWIEGRRESFVGSSYYYIREDRERPVICRMKITGGYLYSIDVIDHDEHGITDDEIAHAIRFSGDEPDIPGHYHIDGHIGRKLHMLPDA
ncbi:MAG TPA: hypothetical protein VMS89_04985 [Methanoregulaceae archaeon]|nr:hypothetical protein [Methanoregulaceae archaeon]